MLLPANVRLKGDEDVCLVQRLELVKRAAHQREPLFDLHTTSLPTEPDITRISWPVPKSPRGVTALRFWCVANVGMQA